MNEQNLPLTRREQFKEIITSRFFDLVWVSLYSILFFIPLLSWNLFVNYSFLSTFDNIYNPLLVYTFTAVFIGVAGSGLSGAFYFMKKLVLGEGASVHQDFFLGVKNNGVQFFGIYLILGIIYGSLHFGNVILYLDSSIPQNFIIIFNVILYIGFFFAVIITSYMACQSLLYITTKKQLLINAVKFASGNILVNLPLMLLILLPFGFYEFMALIIVEWIMVLLYGFFYLGFGVLLITLTAYSLFDRTINKSQFPELYQKGLRKE